LFIELELEATLFTVWLFSISSLHPSKDQFGLLASTFAYITGATVMQYTILVSVIMGYWSDVADWTNFSFHMIFTHSSQRAWWSTKKQLI
jgi:hypothetical protein